MLWETLMEELFFFLHHFGATKDDCMSLPVHERKWLIQRFITQKQKEAEAVEKAKRKR
jgi:hypothetical protein